MFARKSTSWVLSLLILLALIIPACGGQDEEIELNVWTRFDDTQRVLQKIGDKYEEENPNVTVTVTLFAQRAMEEKVAIALPAGEAGDVLELGAVTVWPYHEQGLLETLPDDMVEWLKANVAEGSIGHCTDPDGKMFTSPFISSVQTMFYNKDYFAEAGLECCPETLDELVDYAIKLTKYDDAGNITRAGLDLRLAGGGFGIAEKWWGIATIPQGVQIVEKVNGGYRSGIDNAAGRAALQFYLDGLYKHKYDAAEVVSDADGFAKGATAMFQRESWIIGHMAKNAPDVNYGTFLMVKGPGDWGTGGGTSALSVPTSSKHKETAFDFIQFVLSAENQFLLLDDAGWFPVNTVADYSEIFAEKPAFETFLVAQKTPGYSVYAYPFIAPAIEIYAKVADGLVAAYGDESMATDPAAVEALIHQMAEETNRILADYDLLVE